MSKVWLITGSSRGLGRAFTEVILEAGHLVVATARKPEQLANLSQTYGDRVRTVTLDVTSPAEVQKAVAATKEAFGRIDVVINNAGYGFVGAFEEMTADEFKGQIDTNFWGVVNVTRAVLPVLREQGFGHIIQVSSVGGRLGVPGLSGYNAAKFAVEGLSEALAQEIKPLGLKLTIVEPGGAERIGPEHPWRLRNQSNPMPRYWVPSANTGKSTTVKNLVSHGKLARYCFSSRRWNNHRYGFH
jgi:NAD(P)-dependent dehydrogenase (short-subunit alcohol dehydrogenase family)